MATWGIYIYIYIYISKYYIHSKVKQILMLVTIAVIDIPTIQFMSRIAWTGTDPGGLGSKAATNRP